jgi:rhodanese-related sulfurtransferase
MEDITVETLRDLLDGEEQIILIDVREDYEYDEDNLGGTLIPLGELQDRINEIEALKESDIYVHCRSGKRSDTAKRFLVSQGFSKVHNILGGILAFRAMEE